MKEWPILFSTPMVQAILDGRKTQTRRIVKPQPQPTATEIVLSHQWSGNDHVARFKYNGENKYEVTDIYRCPYGKIGDILWVRETWRIIGWNDGDPFTIQFKDKTIKRDVYLNESRADDYALECADQFIKAGYESDENGIFICDLSKIPTKWRPSIFMPKEACRIKLEITDIRVERVQDISEEDAKAEGVYFYGWDDYHQTDYKNYSYNDKGMCDDWGVQTAKESYQTLWESINGRGSWEKNPWVWVIEFIRIK